MSHLSINNTAFGEYDALPIILTSLNPDQLLYWFQHVYGVISFYFQLFCLEKNLVEHKLN